MINGASGTPIQMNGEKRGNFLTQTPKAQNRRLIFSPPIPHPSQLSGLASRKLVQDVTVNVTDFERSARLHVRDGGQSMINGVSGTPIHMNGEKGENFLTQAPKSQNRRLIFSLPISFPPKKANVKLRLWKIETHWLKHFFPFIFSFHSKSEPTIICPCSPLGNNLIFL